LAGFYPKDLILEMALLRYINFFGFLLLFVSTGLTVCYSFCLFYNVLSGDFNLFPFYFMGEENLNMLSGILGLLIIAVFVMIYLPFYLRTLTVFVRILGG
jgi:hypothetical protein